MFVEAIYSFLQESKIREIRDEFYSVRFEVLRVVFLKIYFLRC